MPVDLCGKILVLWCILNNILHLFGDICPVPVGVHGNLLQTSLSEIACEKWLNTPKGLSFRCVTIVRLGPTCCVVSPP